MLEYDARAGLQIDTYTGGPQNKVRVVVTHKPTGLSASSTHRSVVKAREGALEALAWILPPEAYEEVFGSH